MSKHEDNLSAHRDTVKAYYVYIHRRADDGKVFYVGKGKRDRHKSVYGRNTHWNRIVSKHGFTSHIVMRFTSEACAFSFERAIISMYGLENLSNMTDGGDGGFVMSSEVIERMKEKQGGHNNPRYDPTIYLFFHEDHGIIACSKYEFRVKTGAAKANVRNLVNGKLKTVYGWRCSGRSAV